MPVNGLATASAVIVAFVFAHAPLSNCSEYVNKFTRARNSGRAVVLLKEMAWLPAIVEYHASVMRWYVGCVLASEARRRSAPQATHEPVKFGAILVPLLLEAG